MSESTIDKQLALTRKLERYSKRWLALELAHAISLPLLWVTGGEQERIGNEQVFALLGRLEKLRKQDLERNALRRLLTHPPTRKRRPRKRRTR